MTVIQNGPAVPFAATETVFVEFGQFTIDALPSHVIPEPVHTWTDAMVGMSDSGILVRCGIVLGPINVTVEASELPPDAPDGWENTVETSLTAASGELHVNGFATVGAVNANAAVSGPGEYRIRISARGRAADYELGSEEPVEDYLVQIWPLAEVNA